MSLKKIQALVQIALLSSLALILSYLETMIPIPVAVPGIKLGLANVAVLIALYHLGWRSAAGVACVKVLASGLLFGSPMMLAYSASGMVLAYLCMVLMRLVPGMGVVPVSMASAIFHNVGQLFAASFMLGSWAVFATLPILAVAACVTGALIGIVTLEVLKSLELERCPRPRIDLGDFSIAPGEHVAFIGANGSGKTTAALQLAGVAQDDGVRSFSDAAIVFQNPDDQIVEGSAGGDVAFGPENRGMSFERMGSVVYDSLAEVGRLDLHDRDVSGFSGGQKQDIAIAGVLAYGPQVVVFDESTAMLDSAARERHRALIGKLLKSGKSVITVTQIAEEAFEADRIVVFSDLNPALVGSPEELLECPELLVAHGVELPPVAAFAYALRKQGVAVAMTNDPNVLEKELACCLAHS